MCFYYTITSDNCFTETILKLYTIVTYAGTVRNVLRICGRQCHNLILEQKCILQKLIHTAHILITNMYTLYPTITMNMYKHECRG